MRHTILTSLFGLLATLAQPAWATIPLVPVGISPPAQLIRDNRAVSLQAHQSLDEGDIIKTGNNASVMMYFADDGVITLGSNSYLFAHSASPPILGRGAVLRIQLLRGELTLDAYPAGKSVPKDYRLNIGPLRIRALGADLWAHTNSKSETVCLHQGAVEITGTAGDQRLDIPGQCLQHQANGSLHILEGAETELKNRLLGTTKSAADVAQTPPAPAIDGVPAASNRATDGDHPLGDGMALPKPINR